MRGSGVNGDAGARTPLLGGRGGSNHQEETGWKRYPKHFLYLTRKTLMSNYVNVLLVFVPLGIIAGIAQWDPVTVFVLNFFAIVPLAALLSFATEQLSLKVGQTLGGLLNATFGNAVELIISIVALKDNEIRIVQSSMLGSILSNILLVLGCCFLVGGYVRLEQTFNMTAAATMSSLMSVAAASLIIPATLYAAIRKTKGSTQGETDDQILILSHGTAIILLVLYVMYLYFQLRSHAKFFDEPEAEHGEGDDEEEHEEVILGPVAAVIALVLVTLLVAVCAEYLVGSIEEVVKKFNISKTFIGLILLPIVGNAAEHVTAIMVAHKDKMDLATDPAGIFHAAMKLVR